MRGCVCPPPVGAVAAPNKTHGFNLLLPRPAFVQQADKAVLGPVGARQVGTGRQVRRKDRTAGGQLQAQIGGQAADPGGEFDQRAPWSSGAWTAHL